LGLVPRQHSTGGKAHLLGISRRGDTYLRTLLTHGARSVIICAKQKPGYEQSWLGRLLKRKHHNVVVCALANHNARVVWALLKHDRQYRADFSPQAA
jgi:transposase